MTQQMMTTRRLWSVQGGRLRFGDDGDGGVVQPNPPNTPPAGAAGPSLYFPPAWDLTNNVYTVQKDDVPYKLAQFVGMDHEGTYPVSSLAKINPGLIKADGTTNAGVWYQGAKIKISQGASDKIAQLQCPNGYVKGSDGRGCVVATGGDPVTPPSGGPPVQGAPPWSTKKKLLVAGAAVVGVGAVGGTIYYFTRKGRKR